MNSDSMLDALLSLPALWDAHASPDGRWVAWVWANVGEGADVFLAPTDGSAAPVRLTDTPDDTMIASWTHDSRALIVSQDHNGDERARLFLLNIDQPRLMQPLTEEAPNYFARGGQLHPNGRWLVYGANLDPVTGAEVEPTYVLRHDLTTGERVVLARPEKGAYYTPEMNHQGTHILYTRQDRHPGGYQVWCVDIEGREDREILNAGDAVKVLASWMPDGERVLFVAEAGAYRKVGLLDLKTSETRMLIDDPTRNIETAYAPYTDGTPIIVVVEVRHATLRASLLDPDSDTEQQLAGVPGNLEPLHALTDGTWIGRYYSATQPTDIVRFSLDNPRPDAFTSLTRIWEHTTLRASDLASAEDVRWTSVDGLEVQGWLYRAKEPVRGTIVYIHGGPTAHSEDALRAEIQYYVSQGFNVLSPNYRGSTGFSLTYQDAIKQDGWGGREQDDIRSGIEAMIDAQVAERGKVGVTGTSYGGYSSWCQITHTPRELVAAAAPICGMTDLVVDYETTRPDLRPYSEEMLGGRPDQVPERYRERSPIHFVQNITGDLLIVQGLRDPNVTPENVHAVTKALQQANVEYQLLACEDEGHGIARPKNQRVLYQRLVEFFSAAFEGRASAD